MTKKVKQLTERDKQTQPMVGETAPKDVFIKARMFAQQALKSLKSRGNVN